MVEGGLPTSVPDCIAEVARMGLVLRPSDGPAFSFELVDERDGRSLVIETFHSDLWTDVECTQAAVRFARYFCNGRSRGGR